MKDSSLRNRKNDDNTDVILVDSEKVSPVRKFVRMLGRPKIGINVVTKRLR